MSETSVERKPCHHCWDDIGYQMEKKVWFCSFCKEIRETSRQPNKHGRTVCCRGNCSCRVII